MACCTGGEDGKANRLINKNLRDYKKRLESEVKLLLLGAGESGKSTVAKQMKIIHLAGFSEQERNTYKSIIYNNVILGMRNLIIAAADLNISLQSANQDAANRILAEGDGYFQGPFTKQHSTDLKSLWADPGIQTALLRSHEFHINDSVGYYFHSMDRIGLDGFVPNEQDILRSRAKTTGIIEIEFDVEEVHFRMVDVGGQRSERKKWIHCFQEVTAVIFCVALSEYDLQLYEDENVNRMHESLRLFREICNSEWFCDTAQILFLNKRDIFEEKIGKTDLSVCFSEYKGGKVFKSAVQYIQEQFLAQNENAKKPIYPHVTCATDTENITVVFNAVKDIVLRKALDNAGIV